MCTLAEKRSFDSQKSNLDTYKRGSQILIFKGTAIKIDSVFKQQNMQSTIKIDISEAKTSDPHNIRSATAGLIRTILLEIISDELSCYKKDQVKPRACV